MSAVGPNARGCASTITQCSNSDTTPSQIMTVLYIRRSTPVLIREEPSLAIPSPHPTSGRRGATNDAKITVCVDRHNNVELRDSQNLKLRLRGATRSGKNVESNLMFKSLLPLGAICRCMQIDNGMSECVYGSYLLDRTTNIIIPFYIFSNASEPMKLLDRPR